ncbi:flagellar basal body rod protein FlgB [Pacificimonas flava]|uniref:Flagellar basal body rod protein FlgB n=1 Tax=Pacificimonas flava TaxID=1234595 RepID=M2U855_9SPHN|nr:flagellar basal body rod protein FlgB [Pacificimonas flava]EMD84168.1 Flagellar basal-body rod protein FlgB [Pacificimonas flava]MBB5279954.1 flagellar basal-body rod protein FlgB [Pacificimonas flava]
MASLDEYFGVSGTALKLRAQRLDMIASNIANAGTPGYKARDLDFGAALKSASDDLTRSNPLHMTAARGGGAQAGYRIPHEASLDGNTVELATEQVAFSENSVRYEATLDILNGRISTMMSALRGE